MNEDYWFTRDEPIVAGNADNVGLSFADENGVAIDITGWLKMTYKAYDSTGRITDAINVAHAAMTKTSSGSGVTDTVIIPFTETDTDITPGRYDQEFLVEVAGQMRTIFRGTLKIEPKIAEAP